jgi:phosphoglycolate phosphatase-like HAD superfamily hydrolase
VKALLLFDIDGTLVQRAAEAHRDAIHAALQRVYGLADPSQAHIEAAGKTDIEIAREILVHSNVPARRIGENLTEFRVAAAEEYAARCPRDLSDRVVPGMAELLTVLAARTDVLLALVTGNLEPIARLKLARAHLGQFFARGQGGFGSDDEDRAALPAIARERAGSPGRPFPRERTWVIGDTPRDIECARADDVRVLAVTTGPYTADDLAGADGVAAGPEELRALLESAVVQRSASGGRTASP